jgi:hypothetical protein
MKIRACPETFHAAQYGHLPGTEIFLEANDRTERFDR